MRPDESLRVSLFLLATGSVILAGSWACLVWLTRRLRHQKIPLSRFQKITATLLGLGVLCMAYGYWVEPYWPQITIVPIASTKLAKLERPIRVVQLSDIHSDAKVRLEKRLPTLIAEAKPDAIVFTGDCVNSPDGLANFKELMLALSSIAPVYVVKGNWDAWIWPGLDFFGNTGVVPVGGSPVRMMIRGQALVFAGVDADQTNIADSVMEAIPDKMATIFLSHFPYPDILSPSNQTRVDLFCAGHVHGGQVAIPFYGALLTLSRFGKTYERGLYNVGFMKMYVSRGIGMEGGAAPRVRFSSRPDIAVFELNGV